ncbi:DUF4184 family protein [Sphaerisporangium sp. NPDC004334]
MPFTLSHVVAVVPLRRWLPSAGLVVGAVVPDLAYYLPLPYSSGVAHDWRVGWLVDVPAGLVVLAVFHLVLRAPLTALAPGGVRARLPDRGVGGRGPATVAALVAGMATHLAWDAFTHVDGVVVTHWPVMRLPVLGVHRVFNVVMYVSSLAGLAVLVAWFARWYRRVPPRPGRFSGVGRRPRRLVVAGGGAAAGVGAAVLGTGDGAAASIYDQVRAVLLGATAGFAAVLVAYAAMWHLRRLWTARRGVRH